MILAGSIFKPTLICTSLVDENASYICVYSYQVTGGCCRFNPKRWMYWTTGKLSCILYDGGTYLVNQRYKEKSEFYTCWTYLERTAIESHREWFFTATLTYSIQTDATAMQVFWYPPDRRFRLPFETRCRMAWMTGKLSFKLYFGETYAVHQWYK